MLTSLATYVSTYEHGHENILPLSRLHAEASSDQANLLMLAHQPSQMCYGTSENHGCDIDEQRSHTSQPRLMPRLDSGTSDAESESRNNLPASDIKGRISQYPRKTISAVNHALSARPRHTPCTHRTIPPRGHHIGPRIQVSTGPSLPARAGRTLHATTRSHRQPDT